MKQVYANITKQLIWKNNEKEKRVNTSVEDVIAAQ
jgi:hypothetical protein